MKSKTTVYPTCLLVSYLGLRACICIHYEVSKGDSTLFAFYLLHNYYYHYYFF